MPVYISMLRGVNVGGKTLPMKELAVMYESLGFNRVRTYIQSGNVIFEDKSADLRGLERDISQRIKEKFGLNVSVMVRTPDYFRQVIETNPLATVNTKRLFVAFLDRKVDDTVPEAIVVGKAPGDEIKIAGDRVYFYRPESYSKSKLDNNSLERQLKVIATTRNWTSVNKLLAMADE